MVGPGMWAGLERLPDLHEAGVALLFYLGGRLALELGQCPGDGVAGRLHDRGAVAMGPADRLGDDDVDDPKLVEILGRDLHVGRGIYSLGGIAPEDGGGG